MVFRDHLMYFDAFDKRNRLKPVLGAFPVLHIPSMSKNSQNQTQTAIFTHIVHPLLPGDHTTRIYSCLSGKKNLRN